MLLVAVLILFLLTEFPQGILGLMSGIMEKCFFEVCYQVFGEMMDLLALINAAVDFVLYGLMSKQFRTTFKSLFFKRRLGSIELTRVTRLTTTCVWLGPKDNKTRRISNDATNMTVTTNVATSLLRTNDKQRRREEQQQTIITTTTTTAMKMQMKPIDGSERAVGGGGPGVRADGMTTDNNSNIGNNNELIVDGTSREKYLQKSIQL